MTEPLRAKALYVAPLGTPEPVTARQQAGALYGLSLIESRYVPEGTFLIVGDRTVVAGTATPPARLTRRARLARWLRALPHRLCPC